MAAWQITCKDLRLLTRDRRALAVLLVMPIVFIAILGLSTGQLLSSRSDNEVLRLAIVNQDLHPVSAKLISNLKKRPGVDIREVEDTHGAEEMVQGGARAAAVIIGPQFQQRADELDIGEVLDTEKGMLASGLAGVDIHIYTTGSLPTTGAITEMIVFGETLRTLAPYVARKDRLARRMMDRVTPRESQAAAAPTPATPPSFSTGYGSVVYQVLVPSYTVMFMFFLITIMARSFITERDLGTLARLRTAPISYGGLLTGKTVPFYLVSLIQGLLLFAFGKLLFGMTWGPEPWMLLPVLACTSLAATTLGLLTATIVRTDTQVASYATLVVITMAGISGCFMPREWLPDIMRKISLVTPHAWSLIALDQLLTRKVPDVARAWRSCGMLLAMSAAFFSIGWVRFRFATEV